jgi:methylmalonyl-CoA mutase C-terminal domain/subunit
MGERPIRVVLAKPGLDGHEAGVRLIARVLRDAGMEVIYLGARQTPSAIVTAAVQEDADIIGLSILSGIHKRSAREINETLRSRGAEHIAVFMGGIIPAQDVAELRASGVAAVFGPGTNTQDVVDAVRASAAAARKAGKVARH